MIINHNLSAMNTHRQLGLNNSQTSKSLEKLSSGLRINNAGDDAAGLAISEKMRAQIRGLNMASKNTQDAISLVQTAEGALQETHNILQRMRELAVQSASDTNEESVDRAALQAEFKQLQAEIDNIAATTRFNDQNLIDGTFQKNHLTLTVDADKLTSGSGTTTQAFVQSINGLNVQTANYLGVNKITVTATAARDAEVTDPGVVNSGTVTGSGSMIGALTGVTITWSGAVTSEHNGNTYRLEVAGSDATNMTFHLMDSDNNIVSSIQNVDTTQWYGPALSGSGSGGNAGKLNFVGVGTLTVGMDSGTRIEAKDVDALVNMGNIKIAINNSGQDQVVTPAVKGAVTFTLNGESVTLYKGDDTVNFTQAGVSFKIDALSDLDLQLTGSGSGSGINHTLNLAGSATSGFYANLEIKQYEGAGMIIQTGANQGDELRLNIDAMSTYMLGVNFSRIDTQEAASKAITEVNNAINIVSTQRASLGAISNRLSHKTANLDTSAENLQAAESRIRDVDMAKEMMLFTQKNILTQAATAMLAQANQLPQNVLQLLR